MQPVVVAHRGASAHDAEHTLAAYRLALQQGAHGLECDIRLTRDGHLVCMHDRTVARTSTGSGAVSGLTLDRMATFGYGAPREASRASTRERGLLTFERLLEFVTAHPGTMLFVETKHPVRYAGSVERSLVAQLERYGLGAPASERESPVVVMSFSASAVRRLRRHAPHLPSVLLMRELGTSKRDRRVPRAASVVGPSIRCLREDSGYVAREARRGHPTYCWTVDDPADVALCARLGVRYLATNSPARARALLAG